MNPITREDLDRAMSKLGNDVPPEMKKHIKEAFLEMIEKDVSAKEALGITEKTEELLYDYAYKLFRSGKYKPALGCFSFLRSLEPTSYRYTFAIAACHQYMKQYSEAAANYIICTYIDLLNPIPHFHLHDCFLKMKQPLSALKAIEMAVALASKDPNYALLKERAELEANNLKEEMKKTIKPQNPSKKEEENI